VTANYAASPLQAVEARSPPARLLQPGEICRGGRQGRAESRAPVSEERTEVLLRRALVNERAAVPSGTCRLLSIVAQKPYHDKRSSYHFQY